MIQSELQYAARGQTEARLYRAGLLLLVVSVGGLFGYYFTRDRSERQAGDKARDALRQVQSTVVGQGIEGLVHARLVAKFGYEQASFLHAHLSDGKLLIYGLAPAGVGADVLKTEAQAVPGVTEVEVLINPRPEYVKTIFAKDRAHPDRAAPAPAAPPSSKP